MTLCVALFLDKNPVLISDTLIALPEAFLMGKKTTIPSTAVEAGPINVQSGVTHGVAGLAQKIFEIRPGTVMIYAGSSVVASCIAESLKESSQGPVPLSETVIKIFSGLLQSEVDSVDFLIYQHNVAGNPDIYTHRGTPSTHEFFGNCWCGGSGSGETCVGLIEMGEDKSIVGSNIPTEDELFKDFLNAYVLCSKRGGPVELDRIPGFISDISAGF